MNHYILYDERGIFEPENASVLECFEASNDADAFRHAVKSWPRHAWALHGENGDDLLAWQSLKKKSVSRWFYQEDALLIELTENLKRKVTT